MDSTSPVSATPTLVDPSDVTLLGWVEGEKAAKSKETTPAGKKKRSDDSPKPSKKKSSSKLTSDDLKSLDEKWSQRFARLETMLLAKSFAVLVEPVKKPTAVVTSDQPFFDPGAGTSMLSVTQPDEVITGASLFQTTRDVAATQPVEAPSTRVESTVNMNATQPVEAPSKGRLVTQPVEAPRARTANWPVEVPGARTDVHAQPTGTGDVSAVDRSLTINRTMTATTGVSDTEDELESPAVVCDQEVLSDRDPAKDNELDQEF